MTPITDQHSITSILTARAKTTPERAAYIFHSQRNGTFVQTDGDLHHRATKLAGYLSNVTDAGSRVLLLFPPGPEYTVAFFGCLYAGIVAVPLYPPSRRRQQTVINVIGNCAPSLVLTTQAQQKMLETMLTDHQIEVAVLAVDTDTLADANALPEIQADQLAFLQYTSGSTGQPKGVMVRHADLMANQAAIKETMATSEQDLCVSWLPLYHDMGLIGSVLQAMYTGFTSVLLSPMDFIRDPLFWLRTMTHYKATICGGPNFAYDLCVQKSGQGDLSDIDLSSLRLAFNGSEPVRAETLSGFANRFAPYGFQATASFPCYGMAEATLLITGGVGQTLPVSRDALSAQRIEPDAEGTSLVACGATNPHVVVVDPVTCEAVPAGVIGEIWFDGPGVTAGYWNNPEQTAASFGAMLRGNPGRAFLRTGDLGAIYDGQLYVTGRLKDLIIIRGRNFFPQDIEFIISRSHPALEAGTAAAFALDVDGHERVVVLAEIDRKVDAAACMDQIAECARTDLAEKLDLHLSQLVLVQPGSLPKTSSGKIRRSACRDLLLAGELSIRAQHDAVQPALDMPSVRFEPGCDRDVLEKSLIQELVRLTGAQPDDIHGDQELLRLGLDSLMAAELTQQLEETLAVEIQPEVLLDGLTLHGLLDLIQTGENTKSGRSGLPEIETKRLSTEQERLWLLNQLTSESAVYHVPVAFRVQGDLCPDRLLMALEEVARCHSVLRTIFVSRGTHAEREVLPEPQIRLTQRELVSSTPVLEDEALLAEVKAPFDLSAAPPWRVALLRTSPDEQILLFTFHHIISDLQGLAVFLSELARCYDGHLPVGSSHADYGRFVAFQGARLTDESLQTSLAWWRDYLAELPGPMTLPTDRKRPDVAQRQTRTFGFRLGGEKVNALRAWSMARGVTPFTTLFTAFNVLLHRFGNLHDLPVATPVTGRPGAFHETIGFFAYPVVVRTRLTGKETLEQLLAQVRTNSNEVFRHAQVPPARVMEAVRPEISPSYHPLYQTMFSFFDRPLTWSPTGLKTQRIAVNKGAGDLDLFLTLSRKGEALEAVLEYDTALFDEETIALLSECYGDILSSMLDGPETLLADLPLPPGLVERIGKAQERDRVWKLAVAGNFTVEPVEDSLRFWLETRGLNHALQFAPYNQLYNQLLDPQSVLHTADADYVLLLIRMQDLASDPACLSQNLADLINALEHSRPKLPTLLCLCPSNPQMLDADLSTRVRMAEAELLKRGSGLAGVHMFDGASLAETYGVETPFNPHTDREAHIPYTSEWFTALGTQVVRWLDTLQRPTFKVIALDCDNTLWRGVIGESSPTELCLDAPYESLQQFMLGCKQKGFLLALCSKNQEDDVRAVFAERRDMPLALEDIAALKVNWQAKSQNLGALAEELDLGLQSIIFVDDNPIEIAEVDANQSAVTTIALPTDPNQVASFLARHWAFDQLSQSSEDQKRTEMYRENKAREEARGQAPSLEAFLASLDMQVDIRPLADFKRAAQLNQRTNQFRCHPKRLDETELMRGTYTGVEVAVRDRFGDYGIVGQLQYIINSQTLEVPSFLLSCRALGRGVEHRMLAWLGQRAQDLGLDGVDIHFEETERNMPAAHFLATMAEGVRSANGYRFPCTAAIEAKVAAPQESRAQAKQQPTAVRRAWVAPDRELMMADAVTLLEHVREAYRKRTAKSGSAKQANVSDYVAPTTPLQEELANMFSEVLGVAEVGIHDNFMAMGGYSLQGVKLINRIQETYGIELPLALFFEGATVVKLAESIEQLQVEQADDEDFDRILREMEDLTEEEIQAMLAEEPT